MLTCPEKIHLDCDMLTCREKLQDARKLDFSSGHFEKEAFIFLQRNIANLKICMVRRDCVKNQEFIYPENSGIMVQCLLSLLGS